MIGHTPLIDGEQESRQEGCCDGSGEERSQNGADDAARREAISLLLRFTPLRGQGQPGHGQGQPAERHLFPLRDNSSNSTDLIKLYANGMQISTIGNQQNNNNKKRTPFPPRRRWYHSRFKCDNCNNPWLFDRGKMRISDRRRLAMEFEIQLNGGSMTEVWWRQFRKWYSLDTESSLYHHFRAVDVLSLAWPVPSRVAGWGGANP